MRNKFSIHKFLFEEIDNSSLIVFRIIFGLLVFLECAGSIFTGWLREALIEPKHPITYIGFEWLSLTGNWNYVYYSIMAVCGLLIMIGLFYRISIFTFSFMWWACYLMQKTHYNNHYYLLILLSFFMLIVPAHKFFSMDAKRNPSIKSSSCPRWTVLIFMVQVTIVFIYAGIAKLNPDWLAGKPINAWFNYKTNYPVIGNLFHQVWFKWFVVYGGVFFDLLIAPLLLWKRSRTFAFYLCIFFNLFNSIVFQIGVFPYLMIGLTLFFFAPDKIRGVFFKNKTPIVKKFAEEKYNWTHQIFTCLLCIYFMIQILLPIRHLLYQGEVSWTEEGYRMSWHMMLRTKSGTINFIAKDPASGNSWELNLSEYFTKYQIKEMAKKPDVLWQSAQILKSILKEEGYENVEIYVYSSLSLNGNSPKPLVKSNVNLANISWKKFKHSNWVLID